VELSHFNVTASIGTFPSPTTNFFVSYSIVSGVVLFAPLGVEPLETTFQHLLKAPLSILEPSDTPELLTLF
jgi:hypothetical protein